MEAGGSATGPKEQNPAYRVVTEVLHFNGIWVDEKIEKNWKGFGSRGLGVREDETRIFAVILC